MSKMTYKCLVLGEVLILGFHTIDSLIVYLDISSGGLIALKSPSTTLGSRPFCFASQSIMLGP